MSIWVNSITLQELNALCQNTLVDHLGIVFTEIGEDFLAGKMTVDDKVRQPYGIMHGGASCVLAETLGSSAANMCTPENFHCVGLEINTNHIRPISKGVVYGCAKPFHLGRSTQVWSIEIKADHGKLISINRLTLMVIKK